jgi:nicotinamidase-related amidase
VRPVDSGHGVADDSAVLVVVDAQNGFVNHHSEHVVPVITTLAAKWLAAGRPVIFTRYHNDPGSPFERYFSWTRLREPPETDIVPELASLAPRAHAVIDKPGYTLFTPEAEKLIAKES